MKVHMTSESDRNFKVAFEKGEILPPDFDHEAHLRLAYVYLVESGSELAQQRMRQSLLAFLTANNLPTAKFHETITSAWVLAVSHFMNRSASSSFKEFASNSQPLLDSKVMLTHYSPEVLFSAEARERYLEPDLEAIPH